MASKYILVVNEGEVIKLAIRTPQAPRRDISAWLSICIDRACIDRARRYAFRFGKQWCVLNVETPRGPPLKTFPADCEDAAAMWLVHLEGRDG